MDIRAIAIRTGERHSLPKEVVIGNKLKPLQEFVGGLIEVVQLDEDIDIIVNEEGILLDLPLGLYCNEHLVLFGNVLFVSHDDEGEFVSLTDDMVERVYKFIDQCNFNYLMYVMSKRSK